VITPDTSWEETVGLFKYRALVTVDTLTAAQPGRTYPSGTRAFLVHADRIGAPGLDRYFPAMMTWEDGSDLQCGEHTIVTITVADSAAPLYLAAGQRFTLWGAGSGHGVISRRVFFESSPG
jgi:hypothetical protein